MLVTTETHLGSVGAAAVLKHT